MCSLSSLPVSMKVDEITQKWQHYLEYVDSMVVDGLCRSIHCSLQYILTNTERGTDRRPLFECKMELQAPMIHFIPDLDQVNSVS